MAKHSAPPPEDPMAAVVRRLDVVVRLLGAQLTSGMTRKDAILTLSTAGLAPKEVATMLGISPNQVSVALYDAKKSAAKKRKSIGKKAKDGDEQQTS